MSTARARLSEADRRYLTILDDEEWHSATEVAAEMGSGPSGVARKFSNLAQRKLAVWQPPSNYAISKSGRAALRLAEKERE